MQLGLEYEPRNRPPAAPPPPPPGGQPSHRPKPPATFRVTIRGPQLRPPPRAPAISDLDPDHAVCGPDRDRDHLPRSARAAVPDTVPEQLTSSAASSPHGSPGRAPRL